MLHYMLDINNELLRTGLNINNKTVKMVITLALTFTTEKNLN